MQVKELIQILKAYPQHLTVHHGMEGVGGELTKDDIHFEKYIDDTYIIFIGEVD